MNNFEFHKVSAFTKEGLGGNPAGVILNAQDLTKKQRQNIANKVGFSETAFVEDRANREFRLEFFTPTKQIDICGHATVAAFSLLRDKGNLPLGRYEFESTIGRHQVEVNEKSIGLWQDAKFAESLDKNIWIDLVADSLDLQTKEIVLPLQLASTGSSFMLIEVTSSESLSKIKPKYEAIEAISERLNLVGYYIFSRTNDTEIEARMFAPRYGIKEESATGMAAGALALTLKDERLTVTQGHLMPTPSPSLLKTELYDSNRVLVSGDALHLGSGYVKEQGQD